MDRTENYPQELRFTKPITRAEIACSETALAVDLDCDEGLRAVAIIYEGDTWADGIEIRYGVEAPLWACSTSDTPKPQTWRLVSLTRNGSGRAISPFSDRAARLFTAAEIAEIESEERRWRAEWTERLREAAASGEPAALTALGLDPVPAGEGG